MRPALKRGSALTGAGPSFNAPVALSCANDRFFVVDNAGAPWRGGDVGPSGWGRFAHSVSGPRRRIDRHLVAAA